MCERTRVWAACAVAVAVMSMTLAAQESINHASVSGRVSDAQGAVVPGATVSARQLATDLVATVDSDDAGTLPVPLPPGRRLRVHRAAGRLRRVAPPPHAVGRSSLRDPVRAGGGRRRNRASPSRADAPVLESARSQIAATVSVAEVERLPLNGRNFLDIALLAPGVAPPNINSTQLFAETSAVPGVGLSVGSQRNLSNSFIVDGLSANDDAAGLSGLPYGVDAVEQFQVVTLRRPGRTGPGARRLRERRHAQRHQPAARHRLRLLPRRRAQRAERAVEDDAADVAAAVRRQPRRCRCGGAARSTSPTSSSAGSTSRASPPSAAPTPPPSTRDWPPSATRGSAWRPGSISSPVDSLNLLGKVDHAFTGRDQLSVRYSLYDVASAQLARRWRPERAVGVGRSRQPRSGRRR